MTDVPEQTERAYPGKESTPATAEEVLREIAERNAGTDLGTLVNLVLSGITGDDVQAGDTIPEPAPVVGARQTDAQGQEYEYREDGWHRVTVETTVQDTPVTDTAPAPWSPPESPSNVGPDRTPPFGGSPDAPNTTVGEGSSEGQEV